MKLTKLLFFCLMVCLVQMPTLADTLIMPDGNTLTGTIVQTNDNDILFLMDFAAYNFSRANIKQITIEPKIEDKLTTDRINFRNIVYELSKQPWATNISPIPATVIDVGVLENVPYSSFRCGQDYEVNIYGDPNDPAGFEIGVYHQLLNSDSAKSNCVNFISNLLSDSDKKIVQLLNWKKDLVTHDGVTFEITPPTDDDAYNGWWVSVYSESKLNSARASSGELKNVSVAKSDATRLAEASNSFAWSASDLRLSRPTKITFRNKDGILISNATVVRVNDGVSLIWSKNNGSSSGLVMLEDLPKELQDEFGYDPVKTKEVKESKADQDAQWRAWAQQANQTPQISDSTSTDSSTYNSNDYFGGGRVYVHGYFRSNGTYVQPYTRSYPHR